MKRSDITDVQVCQAAVEYRANSAGDFITDILMARTGAPLKVVYAAMERAYSRRLIECGVSLRTAWITEEGTELLSKAGHKVDATPMTFGSTWSAVEELTKALRPATPREQFMADAVRQHMLYGTDPFNLAIPQLTDEQRSQFRAKWLAHWNGPGPETKE